MDRSTAQKIHYTFSATELPEYSGDDVRRIRTDLGMNQEEFASYLGYGSGKNKISVIESGDPARGKIQPYAKKLLMVLDKFVIPALKQKDPA